MGGGAEERWPRAHRILGWGMAAATRMDKEQSRRQNSALN